MGWSLAASLGIHGIALGGLVLSAGSGSPDAPGGQRAPGGAASGGVVLVRLLGESAAAGQAGARAEVSLPQAHTSRVPPPPARTAGAARRAEPRRAPAEPAPALRAASDVRPAPRGPRPSASPLQAQAPAEVASAPAAPPRPPPRLAAVAGGLFSQPVIGMPPRASGPAGGLLASVDLGPGGGRGGGRLDRVARPAAPIRPLYPPRARQRGEEADVALDVWVGAQGDVDWVAVSRSAGAEFDAAALAAVERARFQPALRDGEPVPSRVALRLHFRLE